MSGGKSLTNKKRARCFTQRALRKEAKPMTGYFTPVGYMGLVDGEYMLFATELDYYEYMTDD